MRIKIINTTEAPRRPADYVFHGKKVLEGKDIGRVLHQGTSNIKNVKMEKPNMCPICQSSGKIVYYNGNEGHFRCLVCQHIWG